MNPKKTKGHREKDLLPRQDRLLADPRRARLILAYVGPISGTVQLTKVHEVRGNGPVDLYFSLNEHHESRDAVASDRLEDRLPHVVRRLAGERCLKLRDIKSSHKRGKHRSTQRTSSCWDASIRGEVSTPWVGSEPRPKNDRLGMSDRQNQEVGRSLVSLHLILCAFLHLSGELGRANKSFSFFLVHATDAGPRRTEENEKLSKPPCRISEASQSFRT